MGGDGGAAKDGRDGDTGQPNLAATGHGSGHARPLTGTGGAAKTGR